MKKKYLIILLFIFIQSNSQNWTFNTINGLQGWTPFRLTSVLNPSNVTLTTNGQTNPRFDHLVANVNATLNKFAILRIKVGANGPTLLTINFDSNSKSRVITSNDSSVQTYLINMTDTAWTGTINNIQLAFRTDDGTANGASYTSNNVPIEIQEISFVANPYTGLSDLYVDPTNGNDSNLGTTFSPLKSIPVATDIAAINGIANVYVKSGSYQFISSINITTISNNLITVRPEPNGFVKLELLGFRGFRFFENAKNIEIKGFEIDGKSNVVNHWTILSNYVWQPSNFSSNPNLAGGGIAVNVEEAQDIKITNNYFHDFYQKAVNIENGRYVTVKGNIIKSIALTSLSGGHAIMRQQGSGSFTGNDDTNKYRWDIDGNLIFNVHQRIYSWVPTKGFMNMALDEGKSILIDEIPNHDQNMKARIQNNIIAFFKIDGIRIKPTNNLEVSNNSLYSQDLDHGDGITDTTTGFDTALGTPFNNFKCFNNAVQVLPSKFAFELDSSMGSTGSTSGNNFAGFGVINPAGVAQNLNTNLFVNPENGNFNLNSGISTSIGASSSTINDLLVRSTLFNVNIANDNWEHNHLKNFQTLYDNIPGIEDGVVGNEIVFTDSGIYDNSEEESGRKAFYFAVNETWRIEKGISNAVLNQSVPFDVYDGKYEIIVPEKFSDWYDQKKLTYLRDTNNDNIGDTPYTTIRYGESVIAQNKVFQNTGLYIVEFNSITDFHLTTAFNNNIILDGDILLKFNYPPIGNEVYDFLLANSITSNNITSLFDQIKIEGYTGTYTLEVFAGSPSKLRLTLTNVLNTDIYSLSGLKIYPNPTTDIINFELDENSSISVFDMTGKQLIEIQKEKGFQTIDITGFAKGIYIMKAQNNSKTQIQRIVRK